MKTKTTSMLRCIPLPVGDDILSNCTGHTDPYACYHVVKLLDSRAHPHQMNVEPVDHGPWLRLRDMHVICQLHERAVPPTIALLAKKTRPPNLTNACAYNQFGVVVGLLTECAVCTFE
jgi:hypothetical protein